MVVKGGGTTFSFPEEEKGFIPVPNLSFEEGRAGAFCNINAPGSPANGFISMYSVEYCNDRFRDSVRIALALGLGMVVIAVDALEWKEFVALFRRRDWEGC